MNLGNIWTNYNSNNVRNAKKINSQKKNTQIKKTILQTTYRNEKVFHNIFRSKTGVNKAHSAINSNNKVISGFSNFKKNYKDSKAYWGTPTLGIYFIVLLQE